LDVLASPPEERSEVEMEVFRGEKFVEGAAITGGEQEGIGRRD
jgi:hypothetical protein